MKIYKPSEELCKCCDEVAKELCKKGYDVYRSFYIIEPVYIVYKPKMGYNDINELVDYFGPNWVYEFVKIYDGVKEELAVEVYFPKWK